MYTHLNNRDLLERLMSFASNLDEDLDDTFGNASLDIANIRQILDVLEDRIVETDDE